MTRRQTMFAAIVAFGLYGGFVSAQTPPAGAPAKKPPAVSRASGQQSAPSAPKVVVRALPDRTAIWVGDRLTYTIELICQPGVDILADDLSPDKFTLDGLTVVGNDTDRRVDPGDITTYRFRYYLTTYSVDATTLKIGGVGVRYFVKRPGQRLEDAAPAGEVQVPAAAVAVRSLLPDGQQTYPIRDSRSAATRQQRYTLLRPVGIGLVLISIAPAVFFGIALAGRARHRARRSPRDVQREEQTSLEAMRSLDLNQAEVRREAFARVNLLVRAHLRDVCGVNAPNLTPVEVGPALLARGARISAELVTSVLTACELALYSPLDLLPSAEACRLTVKRAEEVLASGR